MVISLRLGLFFSLTMLVFCTTGCPDPDKRADELFAKQALNRLRTPNDFMQPGSVIIMRGGKAVYADNVTDYIGGPEDYAFNLIAGNQKIPAMTSETGMEASTALKFLDSVLPVKVSGSLKIGGKVKLELVSAQIKRIPVPKIKDFLRSKASESFRLAMKEEFAKGNNIYIGYQTLSANSFDLEGESGVDIAPKVTIGKAEAIEEGEATVKWTKTQKTKIKFEGDAYYVVALKAAKLSYDKANDRWDIDITNFPKTGTLSGDDDNKYAAAPSGNTSTDYRVLDVVRLPRSRP